jgi:hypothetical protein
LNYLEVVALTANEVYRQSELEEVLGTLLSVENTEMGLIALIGKIKVLLPEELAEDLQALIGKRIGILRLDGYRVRSLDREVIAQEHKINRSAMAAPKQAQGVA